MSALLVDIGLVTDVLLDLRLWERAPADTWHAFAYVSRVPPLLTLDLLFSGAKPKTRALYARRLNDIPRSCHLMLFLLLLESCSIAFSPW